VKKIYIVPQTLNENFIDENYFKSFRFQKLKKFSKSHQTYAGIYF
jgi:hypothetical protein